MEAQLDMLLADLQAAFDGRNVSSLAMPTLPVLCATVFSERFVVTLPHTLNVFETQRPPPTQRRMLEYMAMFLYHVHAEQSKNYQQLLSSMRFITAEEDAAGARQSARVLTIHWRNMLAGSPTTVRAYEILANTPDAAAIFAALYNFCGVNSHVLVATRMAGGCSVSADVAAKQLVIKLDLSQRDELFVPEPHERDFFTMFERYWNLVVSTEKLYWLPSFHRIRPLLRLNIVYDLNAVLPPVVEGYPPF